MFNFSIKQNTTFFVTMSESKMHNLLIFKAMLELRSTLARPKTIFIFHFYENPAISMKINYRESD